jgi:hypothetical protein
MLYSHKFFGFALCLTIVSSSAFAAAFTSGDVFAAIGNSQVEEFTPNGVLVQTLNDLSGSGFTTGMAFDGSGNLYVTNFSTGTVSKFNADGTLASTNFMIGGPSSNESIVVNQAGNFIVGGPSGSFFSQFSAAGGPPTTNYTVVGGNGTGGTDWSDLSADQHTLLYDGEGTTIKRFDLTTSTQLSDFGNAPQASVFAFRIIPSGAFAGDVVAADSVDAILFDSSGTVIRHYALPGNGNEDFALNLDPNGTDFWTSDAATGNIWAVNIATGAIDHQFLSGAPGVTFGLVVAGEITAGGPPPPPPSGTPEPGSAGLLSLGILGLALYWGGRKRLPA